ncbi:polysaccharide biosynthesis protein [Sphingorhabdus pulchriflava]|uniref:Polysaccharide biosynthesis protein n=1 Tax=Sphingorhabdus pulchriflava TaxID=2292257 RepID=A0A371B1Z2_9SPHN|nr:nucleoside-diphosphate sugar epimerase/dehydratase [Sphingorhabdus pulchriflava]RDV01463.1 polysaccharide biosynthesis protein [Sphingorhabdus pulchriflava]
MPWLFAQRFAKLLLELPRVQKRTIAISVDILLCLFTVALAYRLRLDAWIYPIGNQWLSYVTAVVLAIPIFVRFGLYRAIFRYVGWYALSAVTLACLLYGAVYALIFSVIGVTLVPRTTGFLQPILLFIAIGASRAAARFLLGGGYAAILGNSTRRRVLIYGAGSAGRQLAGGLANSQEMQVVAFVDDDVSLHGNHLNGKPIFAPDKLETVIEDLAINDVLLAIPSATRQRRTEIVDGLRGHDVTVRTLPGIFELADGKVTISDLRPLQIEDLLGRDPVPPEPSLMAKCIAGKRVLVTGAGGSIGSELCRQILLQNPSHLALIDNSEFNLYTIEQDLAAFKPANNETVIVPVLASVTDRSRMEEVIRRHSPATVYHAAAYKHVPLVETNPNEGVHNNIFGTRTVAELAVKYGVEDFVLISTDKAVRPPNIMGATKRIAEMVLQVMAEKSSTTRFSMVRFGNVLGSSGSVVPLFKKQIAVGGPVTVTHPEVTRYFMTIPEAAQLVIQAGAMATSGDVFVLDMGEPVKIIDLARRMIELSGLQVKEGEKDDGIEIRITGLRSAEKLYEELLIGEEPMETHHPRIMRAREPVPNPSEFAAFISELNAGFFSLEHIELKQLIGKLVPTVKNPE